MDTDAQGNRVRVLAYELWEKDGSPGGRADEYWDRARAMLNDQDVGSATSEKMAATTSARDEASEGKNTDSGAEI